MGVFKPLLPVGPQPVILRDIETAEAAGVNNIIVVTGYLSGELEKVLSGKTQGIRIIRNSRYREEMFLSVKAGISALPVRTDGFFLLPADCGAVSKDTIKTLIGAFAKSGAAVVTHPLFMGNRGHPPLIPARCIERILAPGNEKGMGEILAALPAMEIETNDPGILMDMNTPEDYAILLTRLGFPDSIAPGRCMELLEKYDTPQDIVDHGKQVAALALKIAGLITRYTTTGSHAAAFDMPLLESACLLHDIRRMEPDHARAGMELLLREGYPRPAVLVGDHTDLPGPVPDIGERELLYLADKLCRSGRYVKIDDTIRELEQKYSKKTRALTGAKKRMQTAMAVLETLSSRYGIKYEDFL